MVLGGAAATGFYQKYYHRRNRHESLSDAAGSRGAGDGVCVSCLVSAGKNCKNCRSASRSRDGGNPFVSRTQQRNIPRYWFAWRGSSTFFPLNGKRFFIFSWRQSRSLIKQKLFLPPWLWVYLR